MAEKSNFPEEGDMVLCTVEQILGTTVFVKLDDYGKSGVIATSEIAPGRIRNIRDYVIPNKKIVCKILKVDELKGHIELSLRRVSQKDTKELLEKKNQENTSLKILKIASPNAEDISKKIKEKYDSLSEFLEKSRKNNELIGEFFNEKEAERIGELVAERINAKKIEIRKKISVSTIAPNGISLIKDALSIKGLKVQYLGAPNYSISIEDVNYKEANRRMEDALKKLESNAKEKNLKLEIHEK